MRIRGVHINHLLGSVPSTLHPLKHFSLQNITSTRQVQTSARLWKPPPQVMTRFKAPAASRHASHVGTLRAGSSLARSSAVSVSACDAALGGGRGDLGQTPGGAPGGAPQDGEAATPAARRRCSSFLAQKKSSLNTREAFCLPLVFVFFPECVAKGSRL